MEIRKRELDVSLGPISVSLVGRRPFLMIPLILSVLSWLTCTSKNSTWESRWETPTPWASSFLRISLSLWYCTLSLISVLVEESIFELLLRELSRVYLQKLEAGSIFITIQSRRFSFEIVALVGVQKLISVPRNMCSRQFALEHQKVSRVECKKLFDFEGE